MLMEELRNQINNNNNLVKAFTGEDILFAFDYSKTIRIYIVNNALTEVTHRVIINKKRGINQKNIPSKYLIAIGEIYEIFN